MDDKLGWMYGFWIFLSAYKCIQAVRRLVDFHKAGIELPLNNVLLAVFWTVALFFYGYVMWRRWKTGAEQKVS